MYAIIIVFEYGASKNMSAPNKLLGMKYDVEKAYKIATEIQNIPSENVYIVTDIRESWWFSSKTKILTTDYPRISVVLSTMFEIQSKMVLENESKLFYYYSGHGGNIVNPNIPSQRISFLVLTDDTGVNRKYLPQTEIASIMSGKLRPIKGNVLVKVIGRSSVINYFSTNNIYAIKQEPFYVGVDSGSVQMRPEIFFIFDACQAGSLAGLRYKYVPETGRNSFSIEYDEDVNAKAVAISVTTIDQFAPSCYDGSPFTAHVVQTLNKIKNKITLESLHLKINENLKSILKNSCTPTFTASKPNVKALIPFIGQN